MWNGQLCRHFMLPHQFNVGDRDSRNAWSELVLVQVGPMFSFFLWSVSGPATWSRMTLVRDSLVGDKRIKAMKRVAFAFLKFYAAYDS